MSLNFYNKITYSPKVDITKKIMKLEKKVDQTENSRFWNFFFKKALKMWKIVKSSYYVL